MKRRRESAVLVALDLARKLGACDEAIAWLRSLPGNTSAAAIWHGIPIAGWVIFVAGLTGFDEAADAAYQACHASGGCRCSSSAEADRLRAVIPYPTLHQRLVERGLLPRIR